MFSSFTLCVFSAILYVFGVLVSLECLVSSNVILKNLVAVICSKPPRFYHNLLFGVVLSTKLTTDKNQYS